MLAREDPASAQDDTLLSSSQPIPGWEPTQYPRNDLPSAPEHSRPCLPRPDAQPHPVNDHKRRERLVYLIDEALAEPPSEKPPSLSKRHLLQRIDEALAGPPNPRKRTADSALHDQPSPLGHPSLQSEATTNKKARVPNISPQLRSAPVRAGDVRQKVKLSSEQQHVLELVIQGNSVFFTGSAGTGKSVLLREIIRSLKTRYHNATDAVAITASTGIAACNIGGVTLHSFGGFGLGTGPVQQLIKYVKRNKKACHKWRRTKVLVIDEISMVDRDLFDKFVHIARLLRNNPNAMAGIQLVVTGDFFQLPPVTTAGNPASFAFESELWPEVIQHTFNLTTVFRQKDQNFVHMLNELRFGALSLSTISGFRALSRPIARADGIEPTELFPLRHDVETANMARLNALPGPAITFSSVDGGSHPDIAQRDKILSTFMAPQCLHLKLNCQVMLIKNTDDTLVNGSMGKVIAFRTSAEHDAAVMSGSAEQPAPSPKTTTFYPLVRFTVFDAHHNKTTYRDVLVQPESWKVEGPSGAIIASRRQIPLILSWAMSIHKSQGQTLDLVMAHPRVIQWYKTLATVDA